MTQTTPFQTKKFGAAFLKMLFAIRDFVTMPRQSQYLSTAGRRARRRGARS